MQDLLSGRLLFQQVDRFSQREKQALASCVLTASRELFEKALPGKPALVGAIVKAFRIASGRFTVLLLAEPGNSW